MVSKGKEARRFLRWWKGKRFGKNGGGRGKSSRGQTAVGSGTRSMRGVKVEMKWWQTARGRHLTMARRRAGWSNCSRGKTTCHQNQWRARHETGLGARGRADAYPLPTEAQLLPQRLIPFTPSPAHWVERGGSSHPAGGSESDESDRRWSRSTRQGRVFPPSPLSCRILGGI